jgi:DNA-binding MarR family transcriptional regulator
MILKEFREYLRVPQTTFSSIVKKLEQLGLVRRVINPRDLRSFSLRVTEAGRQIVETHRENDLKQAREILLELDENERGEFVRLFEKAVHRMVRQPVEGSE